MRFYFNEGGQPRDDEEVDFPDARAAIREAGIAALEMAQQAITVGGDLTLYVHSDEGLVAKVTVLVGIERCGDDTEQLDSGRGGGRIQPGSPPLSGRK